MLDDPTTVTLFPSDSNYCAYCKTPAPPNYAHQSTYCLTQQYITCPLKQGIQPDRMPAKLRWKRDPALTRAAFFKGLAGAAVALFLALFFILWMPGIISDMLVALAPTPASGGNWPTLTPSLTPISSPTSTVTLAPAPLTTVGGRLGQLPSPTLTPTATPTPTPSPTSEPTRRRSATSTYTRTPLPTDEVIATSTPTLQPSNPPPTATDTFVPTDTNTPVPVTKIVPTDTPEPTNTRIP